MLLTSIFDGKMVVFFFLTFRPKSGGTRAYSTPPAPTGLDLLKPRAVLAMTNLAKFFAAFFALRGN